MPESTYLGDTPVDLDAFETQSPQPLYAELARRTPFRTDEGMVYLTQMADVTSALKEHAVRSGGEAMGSHRPLIPLNIDGPEHTKYRRLLDPLFAPKRVAMFEPVVRALADELIDAFIDDGQVELFGAFCDPLPSRVFLGILGLPQRDVAFLQEFKEAAIRPRGTTPEAALAYQEEKTQGMYAYLNAELDRREALADPGDDLIAWFLQAEVEGDRLTRENILDIVYLLVIAGLDTVASSLSCLIAWLAQHPTEQERVVNDPTLLPRVIEELMRFESPVPMASRTAVADIDVNGKAVKAGDMLLVIWSAANLDPDVFDHPLDVDFDREKIPHVAFASGFHRCLGSHLARLELRTAIGRLHERIPRYRLAEGTIPEYHNQGVRSVNPLVLDFDRALR
jgi:cytochrome P450